MSDVNETVVPSHAHAFSQSVSAGCVWDARAASHTWVDLSEQMYGARALILGKFRFPPD